MKPILQNTVLPANMSFIVQKVEGSYFETEWHYHASSELILFTEGSGIAFIGDHAEKFESGDIFFLGSNLPHTFQQSCSQLVSAVVIHYNAECWGNQFLKLPECRHIKKLLELSNYGLRFTGHSNYHLQTQINTLEAAIDTNRIILLLQCLHNMASTEDYFMLSNQSAFKINLIYNTGIDKVFQFTMTMFREPISLSQVAAIACMSVSVFCHYFKRYTQKTYIDYLNEIRISYACNQLQETNKSVAEICYESGYNTIVHFHRQFFKLKKTTPLQYRKAFSTKTKHEVPEVGNEMKTGIMTQYPFSYSFN